MKLAYYNEIDPYAAQWLRNLIDAGHIAAGDVDERSITDVQPADLTGYRQCHFFAGIGGWSLALRLAGWPDDCPVWTGSCPCQPFSLAGRHQGLEDPRHLWPSWFRLISERRPSTLFGEQAETAIQHGWLDLVRLDVENAGYRFAAAGLPAACVGAPHIRQRVYFAADRMADPSSQGLQGSQSSEQIPDAQFSTVERGRGTSDADPVNQFWRGADWILFRDFLWRPVESGSFPLADGVPGRVGRLRAYGNAIVPQVAAEFIRAFETARQDCAPHQQTP